MISMPSKNDSKAIAIAAASSNLPSAHGLAESHTGRGAGGSFLPRPKALRKPDQHRRGNQTRCHPTAERKPEVYRRHHQTSPAPIACLKAKTCVAPGTHSSHVQPAFVSQTGTGVGTKLDAVLYRRGSQVRSGGIVKPPRRPYRTREPSTPRRRGPLLPTSNGPAKARNLPAWEPSSMPSKPPPKAIRMAAASSNLPGAQKFAESQGYRGAGDPILPTSKGVTKAENRPAWEPNSMPSNVPPKANGAAAASSNLPGAHTTFEGQATRGAGDPFFPRPECVRKANKGMAWEPNSMPSKEQPKASGRAAASFNLPGAQKSAESQKLRGTGDPNSSSSIRRAKAAGFPAMTTNERK